MMMMKSMIVTGSEHGREVEPGPRTRRFGSNTITTKQTVMRMRPSSNSSKARSLRTFESLFVFSLTINLINLCLPIVID
jgi:hypothetical protein